MLVHLLLVFGALAAVGCDSSDLGGDTVEVRALVDRQVTEYLRVDPELASSVAVTVEQAGGPYAGRLVDYGPSAERERRAMLERFVSELDAVVTAGLSDADRTTVEVARSIYAAMTASGDIGYGRQYPFSHYGHSPYLVNQISGPHIDIPYMMTNDQVVTSVADADDYLRRLGAFGVTFATVEAKLRADAEAGVTAPRVLLERTLEVLDGFVVSPIEENTLVSAFDRELEDARIDEPTRQRLVGEARRLVETTVYPAYRHLREVVAELVPKAHTESGVWAVPDGDAFYRANIRALGGSDLSAEAIHEIGLGEVDRITAELDTLFEAQGLTEGSVGVRVAAAGIDSSARYPDSDAGRQAVLDDLNGWVREVSVRMPDYFGFIPAQAIEVRRIPVFQEATAPGGYYAPPSLDGTRPGVYYINLRDMGEVRRFALRTLTYHEAIPGHHHQIATQLSVGDLPLVRQLSPFNAYVEGWALYAEQLASEMGLYGDDPWGDIGRLVDELFRAVRLVVDTGIHQERWTREQAIAYMTDVTGKHASEVVPEIERYMAWPGQALGYKMGMLGILALRADARERLGDAFDLRAFHDAVLRGGAVPLDVLEQNLASLGAE